MKYKIGTLTIFLQMIFVCMLSSAEVFANDQAVDENISGEKYFNEKSYTKAFPLLEDEAIKGVKPSIYRLAYMYQNGLGVNVNYKKAAFWFQQAASDFSYTLVMDNSIEKEKKSFIERLKDQINPASTKEGNGYIVNKMDTNTTETAHLVESVTNGDYFGLQPYETNYILPVGYSTHKYLNRSANTEPQSYYDKNVETEFQISLTKMLTYNLFNWNEYINFAYTQKVWWQVYSKSAPFRETNYLPELFLSIPMAKSIDEKFGLKIAKLGFLHESNGQDGVSSRSWNRVYLSGMWQWDNLFLTTRLWYRIPEREKNDNNVNIQDYLGCGDIKIKYLYGKSEFGSLLRYNLGSGGKNRGAIDAHWSYPFFDSENTFWYIKTFSGYGESLIDYDHAVTKVLFGFSFSRDY